EHSYPNSYNATVEQAKREIQQGYMPPIKTKIDNIDLYDTIFVGSPNWWSTIAPPVATFLSTYDLSGKTIVPFCSHGGGGQGKIVKDIAKLCPRSNVLEPFVVYGGGTGDIQSRISEWLHKIGFWE
ncbi:flavodoxin, partial [bacterium]|nr:flavodoxin [bacterium]